MKDKFLERELTIRKIDACAQEEKDDYQTKFFTQEPKGDYFSKFKPAEVSQKTDYPENRPFRAPPAEEPANESPLFAQPVRGRLPAHQPARRTDVQTRDPQMIKANSQQRLARHPDTPHHTTRRIKDEQEDPMEVEASPPSFFLGSVQRSSYSSPKSEPEEADFLPPIKSVTESLAPRQRQISTPQPSNPFQSGSTKKKRRQTNPFKLG